MVRPDACGPVPHRLPQDENAHALLVAINRYAATFELMLLAWRDRSIYDTVRDDLEQVAGAQKAGFPEAGVAMMGLAMAHSDVAAVLLEREVAASRDQAPRFSAEDLQRRRSAHQAAIEELRSYVLRKTH